MIDWIHEVGKDWGVFMRRPVSGYPPISLVGKCVEFGSVGAAIKGQNQGIHIDEMPEDVLEFHNAWRELAEMPKRTLFVFYVLVGRPKEKSELLHCSKSSLYTRRDGAQDDLWVKIEQQKALKSAPRVRSF